MTDAAPPSALPPTAPPPAAGARSRWPARLLTLALIAALAGGAYGLVQRSKAPQGPGGAGAAAGPGRPAMGPPGAGAGGGGVTVGTAQATQGRIPVWIEALGTVTPPVTATLVPQVSGVLTEVLFTEGQMVQKGQVLARIDARPYEQTLAQARSQRARDEAQLAAARVTLSRYQTLLGQDSIARQDVDTQAALVQQLQAVVQSGQASERAAQLNVGFASIRAPISGRIGLRAVDPGNLVGSGNATGIATITQITPIDVVFSVPQDRVQAVLAAQRGGALPVLALDRERRQTLAEGRFSTLDNQINTATGTVRAKARFANTDGALFPNQFVNARLQLGHESGVLVPVTAVRTGPQGDYVYVVDGERRAHMRAVTRALATAEQVLIGQGLQAGERVVTEGGDRVKDGARVQLAGGAADAQALGAGPAAPAGALPAGRRGAASHTASPAGPAGPTGPASAPAGAASAGLNQPPALAGQARPAIKNDSPAAPPREGAAGAPPAPPAPPPAAAR